MVNEDDVKLSFSMDVDSMNEFFREFKKGGERPWIPVEYDYINPNFGVKFVDAAGSEWIVQILNIQNGAENSTDEINYNTVIISPDDAIIMRDGEYVESFDGFVSGLVTIDNGAVVRLVL